jgi:alginate O-acetyltransferase complex protein AlgI
VIWGLLHGFAVAATHEVQRVLRPVAAIPAWIKIVLTFHFVTVAWIFFRAPSLGKAAEVVAAPFVGRWNDFMLVASQNAFSILLIAIALCVHRFDSHWRVKAAVRRLRPEIVWPTIALCWVLAISTSQGSSAKFIYFDF